MSNRPSDGDDAVDAYGIPAFCKRHDISTSFYHKLQAQGLGPATLKIGSRVTKEAARQWRKRHTEASSATTA